MQKQNPNGVILVFFTASKPVSDKATAAILECTTLPDGKVTHAQDDFWGHPHAAKHGQHHGRYEDVFMGWNALCNTQQRYLDLIDN